MPTFVLEARFCKHDNLSDLWSLLGFSWEPDAFKDMPASGE